MKKIHECLEIKLLIKQIERAIIESEMDSDFVLFSIEFIKDDNSQSRKLTLRGYANRELDERVADKVDRDTIREIVSISRLMN